MAKPTLITDQFPEPSDVVSFIRSDPMDFADPSDNNVKEKGNIVRISTDIGRLWYSAMFYRHSSHTKRILGMLASDPYYDGNQTIDTVTPESLAKFWRLGPMYTTLFVALCTKLDKMTVNDFAQEFRCAGVPTKKLHLHSMDRGDLVQSIFATNPKGFGVVHISPDLSLDKLLDDIEKNTPPDLTNSNDQIGRLQSALEEKEREIAQLTSELKELKNRNEQLGLQASGLKREVAEATQRESEITAIMADLTSKLEEKEEELDLHTDGCPFDQSVNLAQKDFKASKVLFEKWLDLMQHHIEPNTRGPLRYMRRYTLFSKLVEEENFRYYVADNKVDDIETMANTVIAQCLVETGNYNKADLGATKFGMSELRDELGKLTTSPESLHNMFNTLMKKSDVILETLKSTNFKFGGSTVNPKVDPNPLELASCSYKPPVLTNDSVINKKESYEEKTAEEMEMRYSSLFG